MIEIANVNKSFGSIRVLKNVCLNVEKGTIHALIGENGAGKSTLMKILSGIYEKDSGSIRIDGQEVHFRNPKESQDCKIGIIHQELALSPDLTVAENIFLDNLGFGRPIIQHKILNQRAKKALSQLGFHIAPTTRLGDLSVAYQQMVEIAKTLTKDVKVLILDEPTAVLSDQESEVLFEQLFALRDKGVTIIYISHRLEEILKIANKITVIKDGETVKVLDAKNCVKDDIIENMVGRTFENLYPVKNQPSDQIVLEVNQLSTDLMLKNISLTIKKGEIVGLSGLVGSGRTEVARCLFGIDPISHGQIKKNGQLLNIQHPAHAMQYGIGLVPENRKEQGAILDRPIQENMTLANLKSISFKGIVNALKERRLAEILKQRLSIKLGALNHPISSLSGGNQQKVVIAKWLNTQCDVLILDEPTRGVDVGAKVEIYNIIQNLALNGYAILVISSELLEIIGLCHRTYVMSEGQITGQLLAEQMNEQNIMKLAIPKREQ